MASTKICGTHTRVDSSSMLFQRGGVCRRKLFSRYMTRLSCGQLAPQSLHTCDVNHAGSKLH